MLLNNKINKKIIKEYLGSFKFQKLLIGILTLIVCFVIIESGAIPKKYKLQTGMISTHDIIAPRDIENTVLTEMKAVEAANNVAPEVIRKSNIPIEVINSVDDFFIYLDNARKKDIDINQVVEEFIADVKNLNLTLPLSNDQYSYLVSKTNDDDIFIFKKNVKELVSEVMIKEVTSENLAQRIDSIQNSMQEKNINQELKNIGGHLLKSFIKPNTEIDKELTELKRKEAYENSKETNKIIVKKNSRIISVQELVTQDKMQMLKQLNLIETGKIDYVFLAGILVLLLLLTSLFLVFIKIYCKDVLDNRNNILVLAITIILTLLSARILYVYSPLFIPFSIAAMLIAILIDLKLAIIVNIILSLAISIMTKGDLTFLYMSLLSGTFAPFLVYRANQRSTFSASGLFAALSNVVVVACFGVINKSQLITIAIDSAIVIANGLVSIIITIGMLPFWETTFNMITPLKLMELSNPNQPLLKRLMIEAPGTYHHSLMVGNLAEVAVEDLGGNALLARVGAYYHDVGKLVRPDFFGENQIGDNPHDKMTASLSTFVIIAHAKDGVKIAEKYKLPNAIKDIIVQHHGTTLVAYFYHKATKEDKTNTVIEDTYRYPGPKPMSKEAAVVMLADSVEAAVRSMSEKTECKINKLVRKIIKDKLDDGQLDLTAITLKDLDMIAKSFTKVFSGFFHAREKYPELIKVQGDNLEQTTQTLPTSEMESK